MIFVAKGKGTLYTDYLFLKTKEWFVFFIFSLSLLFIFFRYRFCSYKQSFSLLRRRRRLLLALLLHM